MFTMEAHHWEELFWDEMDRELPKDAIAATYGFMILYGRGATNWGAVNRAIIERWSKTALEQIKRKAWKRIGR